jgi:hypothetical protein
MGAGACARSISNSRKASDNRPRTSFLVFFAYTDLSCVRRAKAFEVETFAGMAVSHYFGRAQMTLVDCSYLIRTACFPR